MKKKNKHGGKRKGSGAKRKPEHLKKEKTRVKRIPVSLMSHVQALIDAHVVGLIKKV